MSDDDQCFAFENIESNSGPHNHNISLYSRAIVPHLWIVYFYALSFHVQDHKNNRVSDRMPEGCSLIFWYIALKYGSIASSNLTVMQLQSSFISSLGNKVTSYQAAMRLLSKNSLIDLKCLRGLFCWMVHSWTNKAKAASFPGNNRIRCILCWEVEKGMWLNR